MLIGKMNHPGKNLIDEIGIASRQGFDYLDLTLEGPAAQRGQLSAKKVRKELARQGLGVVGHTAYYLPIDSCIERVQAAAIAEIIDDLHFFAKVGAEKVTLHFGYSNPLKMFSLEDELLFWNRALTALIPETERLGVHILLEQFESGANTIALLERIFTQFPSIGFHLDVGHANLIVEENATSVLLEKFSNRLAHVHLSDNFGRVDLHLPLYCGNIDWKTIIDNLKQHGYDDTITLEVFADYTAYLILSKKILRDLWAGSTAI